MMQAERTRRALTLTLKERPTSANAVPAAATAAVAEPLPAVAVVEQVEEELMLAPFANRVSRESLAEFQV